MSSEEQQQQTETSAAQAAKSSPAKAASLDSSEEASATAAALTTTEATATENASNQPAAGSSAEEELDATVRISKDSQVRKLISFVMGRLERGGTVKLQALNQCVHKAITVALISRDRLGNIFQVNSLLVVQEGLPPAAPADTSKVVDDEEQTTRVRTTSGIQIILSKSPLDDSEVGYEKPMPKGFVQQVRHKRYQDRRQRKDEIRAAEQKAASEKAAAEKASAAATSGKRRPASRRGADKAEKDAPEAKDAPISAKAQRRRQSRSKPEKQPEKQREVSPAEQAPAGKPRRRRQQPRNRNRSKADDKERSLSEEQNFPANQGRQRYNRNRRGSDQQNHEQIRRDAPPPKPETSNRMRQQSPADYDYMGREVPRNSGAGNRRMNTNASSMTAPAGYDHQYHGGNANRNAPRNNSAYQRRGAPYEVGQSFHYMHGNNFHNQEAERYFAQQYQAPMHHPQQGRRGGYRGFRGGADQARPGYFPASRKPQRPEQLMDDMSYGGSVQQRRQPYNPVNNGYRHD